MKVIVASSLASASIDADLLKKLESMKGVFLPGINLLDVEEEGENVKLTFKVEAGFAMTMLMAIMKKLMRVFPPSTKMVSSRFAGKTEPFVITLRP